jgi:aryl-alcohol dehydrogenase-like predicted oxidoreductase
MKAGCATAEGTARFQSRFPTQAEAGFYRRAQGLQVSSLGLGTYLGAPDEKTDRGYLDAVVAAVRGGINFIDSAINYRHQRSERSVGRALAQLFDSGEACRDELVISTKAGHLVPSAYPSGVLKAEDVVSGVHSIAPAFLADQVERSRDDLNLETIDIFYLHYPEAEFGQLPFSEFEARIGGALATLEGFASKGAIRYYGAATWNAFRRPEAAGPLYLRRLLEIALKAGGESHHFRFVQLPFNLAMVEAFVQRNEVVDSEPCSVLEIARRSGVTVVGSATLLQARLARNLPKAISQRLPGAATDAQRAIQFARSTPGLTVALVGMSKTAHVEENLGVSTLPVAPLEDYMKMFPQVR